MDAEFKSLIEKIIMQEISDCSSKFAAEVRKKRQEMAGRGLSGGILLSTIGSMCIQEVKDEVQSAWQKLHEIINNAEFEYSEDLAEDLKAIINRFFPTGLPRVAGYLERNVIPGGRDGQNPDLRMFQQLENARKQALSRVHTEIELFVHTHNMAAIPNKESILLEPEQVDLLCKFIEAEHAVPKGQRGKFLASEEMAAVSTAFIYTGGAEVQVEGSLTDAEILAEKGLLGRSFTSRGEPLFHIRPDALEFYRKVKNSPLPVERVEQEMRTIIASNEFERYYPSVFSKWAYAESMLWGSDSHKQFTTIGHLCREILQDFAEFLVSKHQPADADPDRAKTVSRIRSVLKAISDDHYGSKEKAFLDQLVGYWGTVSDLVQRQEHGAQKEGKALNWEDARRVVFQTLVVMYEIHRSLTARSSH